MGAKPRQPPHARRPGLLLGALALVALTTTTLCLTTTVAAEKQTIASGVSKQDTTSSQLKSSQITADSLSSKRDAQPQQQVAERKQGDQPVESLFNTDEYVQIKPEEITKELDGASLALADIPQAAASASSSSSSSTGTGASGQSAASVATAEHKSSVDDELSAHLAQEDSISSLESGPRAYAAPPADPRAARPQYAPARGGYMPSRGGPSRGGHNKPRPYGGAPAPMGAYGPRGPRSPPMGPPRYGPPMPMSSGSGAGGYMSLKGKIADGLSSMVPHAPRPYGPSPMPLAPMPHRYHSNSRPTSAYHASSSSVAHPPRYLPRGAAAGYAAFREFVRAQAHRYKQQNAQLGSTLMSSHEPLAYNAAPPAAMAAPSYGSAPPSPTTGDSYRSPGAPSGGAGKPYGHEESPKGENYDTAGPQTDGAAYGAGPKPQTKTKVTVAQAYIPQAPAAAGPQATGGYGSGTGSVAAQSYSSAGAAAAAQAAAPVPVNPVLAKLYGAHAPQGVGRPEYNKDYGMVIHYPQATVYTEPMTVDQLHKLAGSSIGQILEQLQYNIASGHRDEGNTLRANNKHHLGHGVSIHAKEYYAPGKHGQYVPTTAAVISTSTSSAGSKYGPEAGQPQEGAAYASEVPTPLAYGANQQQQQSGYNSAPQNVEAAAYGLKPELGSGYERVKAAAAAAAAQQGGNKYNAQQQQQQHQRPHGGYEMQSSGAHMKPYEPLGHIANLIGSELESLYNKANSVLAKQIDPEIHAHVQAHLKTLTKVASQHTLKMSEHEHGSPLVLRPYGGASGGAPARPAAGHMHMRQRAPRGRPSNAYGPAQHGRYPPRPSNYAPHPHPQQHQQRPQKYGHNSAHAHSNQQQQQAYSAAAEQAFQQQMNQMLHDFNLGEENYGAKSQPIQATNQGYPNKVMQKHYQQQQQHQQQQQQTAHSSSAYEHSDGLEIPQGPNDQIGEISELIDALKGTLEQHKPEGYGQAGPPAGSKEHGKLEDVRYLASALGQVPSYAIQVPVGHHAQQQQQQYTAGPENAPAAYETPKKASSEYVAASPQQQQGYQQQAAGHAQQYQQQQQQQPQHQAPAAYGPTPQVQVAAQLPYQAPPAAAPQQDGYGSAPAAHQAAGQTAIELPSANYQQQPQSEYSQHSAATQEGAYGQYNQQQHQQTYGQSYGTSGQQQDSYAAPAVATNAEYGKLLSDLGYGPGQHQQEQNQHQQQQGAAGYGQEGQVHNQQGASYHHQQQHQSAQVAQEHQPAQVQHAEQPQHQPPQQQQAYSTSEHTQVINHLVPVQQPQQSSGAGDSYGTAPQQQQQQQQHPALQAITASVQQQPAHQISVAAPTESQYASAQPLSSFVDSLPSDYQELLRQPAGHAALLDGATHDAQYPPPSAATNLTASPHHHHHQQQHHHQSQHNHYSQQPHYEITKTSASAGGPSAQVAASPAHHHQYRHQNNKYHSDQPHHLVSSASSVSASYQKLASAEDNNSKSAAISPTAAASGTKSAQAAASGPAAGSTSSSTSSSSSSSSSSAAATAKSASSTNAGGDTQASQEKK